MYAPQQQPPLFYADRGRMESAARVIQVRPLLPCVEGFRFMCRGVVSAAAACARLRHAPQSPGFSQAFFRAYLARRAFKKLRAATNTIQAHAKGWVARKQVTRGRRAVGALADTTWHLGAGSLSLFFFADAPTPLLTHNTGGEGTAEAEHEQPLRGRHAAASRKDAGGAALTTRSRGRRGGRRQRVRTQCSQTEQRAAACFALTGLSRVHS